MCVTLRFCSWLMETAMRLAKPPFGGGGCQVANDAKVLAVSALLILHRN